MEYLLSGEGVHEAFVNTISEIIVDIQGAERLTAAKLAKATHITITEPNSLNLPLEVDLINGKELFIYFIPLMEGPHVLTLHYLKKQILKHEIPVSLKHPIQSRDTDYEFKGEGLYRCLSNVPAAFTVFHSSAIDPNLLSASLFQLGEGGSSIKTHRYDADHAVSFSFVVPSTGSISLQVLCLGFAVFKRQIKVEDCRFISISSTLDILRPSHTFSTDSSVSPQELPQERRLSRSSTFSAMMKPSESSQRRRSIRQIVSPSNPSATQPTPTPPSNSPPSSPSSKTETISSSEPVSSTPPGLSHQPPPRSAGDNSSLYNPTMNAFSSLSSNSLVPPRDARNRGQAPPPPSSSNLKSLISPRPTSRSVSNKPPPLISRSYTTSFNPPKPPSTHNHQNASSFSRSSSSTFSAPVPPSTKDRNFSRSPPPPSSSSSSSAPAPAPAPAPASASAPAPASSRSVTENQPPPRLKPRSQTASFNPPKSPSTHDQNTSSFPRSPSSSPFSAPAPPQTRPRPPSKPLPPSPTPKKSVSSSNLKTPPPKPTAPLPTTQRLVRNQSSSPDLLLSKRTNTSLPTPPAPSSSSGRFSVPVRNLARNQSSGPKMLSSLPPVGPRPNSARSSVPAATGAQYSSAINRSISQTTTGNPPSQTQFTRPNSARASVPAAIGAQYASAINRSFSQTTTGERNPPSQTQFTRPNSARASVPAATGAQYASAINRSISQTTTTGERNPPSQTQSTTQRKSIPPKSFVPPKGAQTDPPPRNPRRHTIVTSPSQHGDAPPPLPARSGPSLSAIPPRRPVAPTYQ